MFDDIKPLIRQCSAYDISELGTCEVAELDIELTDQNPIYIQPYRKAMAENKLIESEIEVMLKNNIIQYSKSPFSFS